MSNSNMDRRTFLKGAAAAGVAAAASAPAALADSTSSPKMLPGTYVGYGEGFWLGYKTPVTVTVSEDAIISVETPLPKELSKHGETSVMLKAVRDRLIPRILKNQSIAVDTLTGATVSSASILAGVRDALTQAFAAAGFDKTAVSAFNVAPEKPFAGQTEELECDVLVVGLGTGGLLAMKSALDQMNRLVTDREAGTRVSIIGIDKACKFGGKSAHAHCGLAINPPRYKEQFNGGEDYIDGALFEDLYLQYLTRSDGSMSGKPDVLKAYLDNSGAAIDFMYENGFRFGAFEPSPFIDGISGFNIIPAPCEPGTFEDRRQFYDGFASALLAGIEAQGGRCMLETEGYAYITDGNRVVGVKAHDLATGKEYVIHAKAVIQGTGGFGDNQKMLDEWLNPKQAGPRVFFDFGTDDGKMIQAALEIGAS